ncbi:MAG TPA: chitobiase/beta-hexosaminidase C-terminal domain-containing protein [Catalimonadaceae bacterium]|nr:chitobiase/beta-hexosaminidase C-terminal domain-containing protein [Catalimonadaceae bacterium]
MKENQSRNSGANHRIAMRTGFAYAVFLLLSLLLFLLLSSAGFAQTQVVFDTPGNFTWTPPPGATSFTIQAWGGGAAGGTSGGGGGSYARSVVLDAANYQSGFTVHVGKGGGGNLFSNVTLMNGETSWAIDSSLFKARGGLRETLVQSLGGGSLVATEFLGGVGGRTCDIVLGKGGGGGSAFPDSAGRAGKAGNCPFFSLPTNGSGGAGFGNGGNPNSSGNVPGGGSGGGALISSFPGAAGRVIITYTCTGPGSIGNAHTVTSPKEIQPDYVTSTSGLSGYGLQYTWEKSTDNSTWSPMDSTGLQLQIPGLTTHTYFRRISNTCNNSNTTNSVLIRYQPRNGTLRGYVKSKNSQTGVAGIRITAHKKTSLPGSPASYLYSTTTNSVGFFDIPVYYGDIVETGVDGALSTTFVLRASKANHSFTNDSLESTLTNLVPIITDLLFIDTTVLSITGKVYQECVGCQNNSNTGTETIEAPLDSVNMSKGNSFFMKTGFIANPAPGDYGRYATTVQDPGTYQISASYKNHSFVPASHSVVVTDNMANVDFKDTTTRTISGFLLAGCNDYIGTAVLEFQDVLPNGTNGTPRLSVFRKRVTTNPGSGYYSVRLPARKYKVRVISFDSDPNETEPVNSADLIAFLSDNADGTNLPSALPYDSLVRDITSSNAILNLTYQRPPTIQVSGLDSLDCEGTKLPFATIAQSAKRGIRFNVWQGSASKNCPVSQDSVHLYTNIPVDDLNISRAYKVVNGIVNDTLKGGIPNILQPFYKTFNAQYTDGFGRIAPAANRNVVVTGVKTDAGSFSTVSPQIPMVVLHDPPGDGSFSFWSVNKKSERAMRWSVADNTSTEEWVNAKIGTQFDAGFGVTTETEIWGSINASLNVSSRTNNADESIISTTTTQTISTSSDPDVTGDGGDVFVGAAVNLLYSIANEVAITNCEAGKTKKLIIAQDGFATEYVYTDDAIRNNVIPTLQSFASNPGNTPAQTANYENQISVWQQVLANNEFNKARAAFDKNISFFGSAGPISQSTTTSSTHTSTLEFDVEIDAGIAAELGFEIAGSGVSGGVNVHMKTETGKSTTLTNTIETTTGYTLDDDDALDNFTVNVKKDPVYNTPVFQTVAGQTSCPPEASTLARDAMQLIVPIPVVTGVAPDGEAQFTLTLGNLSVDAGAKTYNLSFDQSSNPFGATITIGGSVVGSTPVPYIIGPGASVNVTVKVKRNTSGNVFSYEGLKFTLSDACTGDISKTASLSALFNSPCSGISLVTPEDNFVCKSTDNQIIPVLFNGYNVANLTSVSLEFSQVGTSSWTTGFFKNAAQINNSVNGTSVDWNVAGIPDGIYNLRLKLVCASGVVYTKRVTGIIDRTAPALLGNPQPTDDHFTAGDEISFSFDEDINTQILNAGKVTMTRMSNGNQIPVTVTGYQNKLVIVPQTNLLAFGGERIRVVVKDVEDNNHNMKPTTDTTWFSIGNFVAATGAKALQISLSPSSLNESDAGTMNATFSLGSAAQNDVTVNFGIGGTASFTGDYSVTFGTSHALNKFNGAQGTIVILNGQTSTVLRLDPQTDALAEGNETIIVTLSEGGDYALGANYSVVATILGTSDLSSPLVVSNGPTGLCPGSSLTLTANRTDSNPSSAVTYLWSNGATTQSIPVNTPGTYSCTITVNDNGNLLSGSSLPFVVNANPAPVVNAGADLAMTQGSGNKYLGGASPTGGTWSGTGISGSYFNTLQPGGTYSLRYCVTNASGCSACDSLVLTVNPSPSKADMPQFSSGTGTYYSTQTISLSSKTPGASIYYTLSGNNPVIGAGYTRLYTTPILINKSATIKAMAVKSGLQNSFVNTSVISIVAAADPVITPANGGVYQGIQTVTITSATPGAVIYYTTNGNQPLFTTPNSFTKLYTGPFTIDRTRTIWALATKAGMQNSGNVRSYISIPPVFFSPLPGTYTSAQLVTLTNITAGAVIYYTIDGTEPVIGAANTFLYTSPVNVTQNRTLRAMSVFNSVKDGNTAVGAYTINIPTAANPAFSPGAGACTSPCSIVMTSPTDGASIYYTTSGNTPTIGAGFTKLYTGPVSITTGTTFKAMAVKSGLVNSGVVTAVYTMAAGGVARKSVDESMIPSELTLFPNPTSGSFSIRGLLKDKPAMIRIWNAAGKMVLSTEIQSSDQLTLDADYPSGLYLVDVIQEGTRKTLRLVKH